MASGIQQPHNTEKHPLYLWHPSEVTEKIYIEAYGVEGYYFSSGRVAYLKDHDPQFLERLQGLQLFSALSSASKIGKSYIEVIFEKPENWKGSDAEAVNVFLAAFNLGRSVDPNRVNRVQVLD